MTFLLFLLYAILSGAYCNKILLNPTTRNRFIVGVFGWLFIPCILLIVVLEEIGLFFEDENE